MGGRGGSSGLSISAQKLEDFAQQSDAKYEGFRLGAKRYEYTDSTGKVHQGETGKDRGGTYRTSYNEQVASYAKMSTSALEKEKETLRNYSNDQYQRFSRAAASRSASLASGFSDADTKIRMINQVLRRRKKK